MHRRHQIRVQDLSRLLNYILGHRPDEFGVVPDPDGYLSYKELLWSIHEETGWGYVKEGDIREVLMGEGRSLFEADENRIRALDRRWHIEEASPVTVPKILYCAVRKRAHAHVMEKGLSSRILPLSPSPEVALRIGRRRDPKPVLLEILTTAAHQKGVSFSVLGSLYLTHDVPAECISGPPVEQEPPRREVKPAGEERAGGRKPDFMPGSFLLDPQRDPAPHRQFKGKKHKGWKENARKLRKRNNQ